MTACDLIRFVTDDRHPPYGHRSGILASAYEIWRKGRLNRMEQAELRRLLDWFESSMVIPGRFTTSRHPRAQETAISWVRASADEHVRRLRHLAAILSSAGVAVDELHTARPGHLVYEDEHQVVALPFADTPR
jgi:hypothetical protein